MRKSADLRKAQIVAVILDLADRIGPDRVTTGAVAAEVGVTQAAIFRHFPTKAEMWVAVADHVAGLLTAAWAEALKEANPPVERLKALVGAQLDQITGSARRGSAARRRCGAGRTGAGRGRSGGDPRAGRRCRGRPCNWKKHCSPITG
jgi:AcrR family transcriptional regulator